MRGFDSKWRDVPDFIIGITKKIWEDREIGSLPKRYADGLIVRSPASVVVDNSNVIAATLDEFPDRALLGEDVIWCDDPEGATETSGAYLSSHRLYCTATHTHSGMYGAPTGRRFAYRILADCAIRDDAVYDEWMVRDQSTIVQQMGENIVDWTRELIAREGDVERCVKPMTPITDVVGPYTRNENDDEWGQSYADTLRAIMAADLNVIPIRYDRACTLHYPGGLDAMRWAEADQFWISLHTAFPDATFSVDHVIGRDDSLMAPRAAVRWSLHGKHSGWGRFGTPMSADIYIMGISHADFGPFGNGEPTIRREHTHIDETAIWKQILLRTGQHE
jgi:hypothetical protein